jgi:hypothetical protein
MKALRSVSIILGILFLAVGVLAALQNGTPDNIVALGHALLIAGAIILAGVLISSAISENGRKG